jgi:hypothetical protein
MDKTTWWQKNTKIIKTAKLGKSHQKNIKKKKKFCNDMYSKKRVSGLRSYVREGETETEKNEGWIETSGFKWDPNAI